MPTETTNDEPVKHLCPGCGKEFLSHHAIFCEKCLRSWNTPGTLSNETATGIASMFPTEPPPAEPPPEPSPVEPPTRKPDPERCDNCRFGYPCINFIQCRRYPKPVEHHDTYWCGDYQREDT